MKFEIHTGILDLFKGNMNFGFQFYNFKIEKLPGNIPPFRFTSELESDFVWLGISHYCLKIQQFNSRKDILYINYNLIQNLLEEQLLLIVN